VFEYVSDWADAPAFIDGPSGRALTFAEVADAARRFASSMAARGFRQGDVFAMYCPNLPEYAVAVHGTLMLGGVVTTANPITHLHLVPPLVLALAKQPLVDAYDLSSLRYILSRAAPLDAAVQQAVATRLHVPVVQGCGMTETSLAIAPDPAAPLQHQTGRSGRVHSEPGR
jgi:acyl-CoA synthetase (AMP-forming)/AMP-acid ligase II